MTEQILLRIQYLVQKGEGIKSFRLVQKPPIAFRNPKYPPKVPRDEYEPHVESGPFEEWRTNALFLIQDVTQSDSLYSTNFEEKVKSASVWDVDKGIGILRALKNAVENGYLTRFRTLVVAEIFDDFLQMAQYLLESDYQDPAASVVGAVLEDGLRQICGKHGISVRKADDISALNQKLGDKQIYNRNIQKQIQAWKGIRDSADHGKFDDYGIEDVRDMLKGVRRFLGENLA